MLTNNELEILSETIEYLSMLEGEKAIYLCDKLDKIYNRVLDNKNKQNKKSNEYNKKNKEYHRLMNSKYYNQDVGNWSKVREIEEKLEQLKDKEIPLF